MCAPGAEERRAINALVEEDAGKGYRTLGVARNDGQSWRYLGLLPLFDPPRDDCAETIKTIRAMGVDIKMVTGDHEAIAKEIAGQLGLGENIVVANAVFGDKAPADKLPQNLVRRRLRPRLPRAQVRDRQGAARRRPHRRHDRRWRQRRAGLEAGRCRHRGERRHRRRTRRSGVGAHGARPFGHRYRDRGGAPHLRADDGLCDLPHRRDDPCAPVHDGEHIDLQLLSGHRDHDRSAGAAKRHSDHDDRR